MRHRARLAIVLVSLILGAALPGVVAAGGLRHLAEADPGAPEGPDALAGPAEVSAIADQVLIEPPTTTVVLGEIFTVEVAAQGMQELAGWDVSLDYDAAVVEVQGVSGDIFIPLGPVYPVTGTVRFGGIKLGDAVNGDGVMAALTLKAIGLGTSPLDLYDVTLYEDDDAGGAVEELSDPGDGVVIVVEELPCQPVEITGISASGSMMVGGGIQFSAAVSGTTPFTYTWDFGGPGVASGTGTATPTFTYTAPATYTVALTVENACPSQDTYSTTIQVGEAPDIDVTPTSFAVAANVGEQVERTLTIANVGTVSLTWALAEDPEVGWLSVTPLSGSVEPTASTPLTVTFDATGLSLGTYTTTLVIDSNDPDEDPFEVPVELTVGLYPDIEVTPTSLEVTLPSGASKNEQLTIANVGDADLMWALVESPAVGWLTELPVGPATVAPDDSDLVIVGFNATGLAFGETYTTTLLINSDDPNEATVEVPVVLTVDYFRRYLPIIMRTVGP